MDRAAYMQEYNRKYKQTPKGLIKYIYNHQIRNCKARNHPLPTYSEKELLHWYLHNPKYEILHNAWIKSGCAKELTPSVDRLDNYKSYSLDNIELVTWKENCERVYDAIRNNTLQNSGLLNNGHTPIVQYSLDGTKISSYISINECVRKLNILHQGVSDACRGKKLTYKGFIWAYAKDESKLLKNLTKEYLEELQKKYAKYQGWLVKVFYVDNTIEEKTLAETSKICNISVHNVKQIALNKISSRTPKLPENIKTLKLIKGSK